MEEEKKDVEKKTNKDMKVYVMAMLAFLVIVVLSVGIVLVANRGDNEEEFDFLSYDIEQFNIKFAIYEGEQIASSVKALMAAVVISNNTNTKELQVEVYFNGELTTAGTMQANAVSTKTYNVEFEYNENLFINKVLVTEKE